MESANFLSFFAENKVLLESFEKRGFYFDFLLFSFFLRKRKLLYYKLTLYQQYLNIYTYCNKYNISINFILGEYFFKYRYKYILRYEISLRFYKQMLGLFLQHMPNSFDKSVPAASFENCSGVIVSEEVSYKKKFTFVPHEHYKFFSNFLNVVNLNTALTMSGTRFSIFYGRMAKLYRVLGQYMLDVHIKSHNYTEVYVPFLVKEKTLTNSGQLPKFCNEQYKVEYDDLWLIPTGEVPLVNLVADKVLDESVLPLKFICKTSCFRKEVGHYGKDLKGIYRQHQFEKVELVQVTHPFESYKSLELLKDDVIVILQHLKLPYRVVLLDAKNSGFTSSKTYDVEVWLPGKRCFQEVSSCSNTEDFQAIRMNAKFKDKVTQEEKFLHLLNGSGLAIGRVLIAIIENYQDSCGNICIPDVLRPYMGVSVIKCC